MLSDALESLIQIFSPSFRTVTWKSLGLTAIVLIVLGLGLDRTRLFNNARGADLAQLDSLDRGRGRSHRAPAASLVAGFYLDNIADTVERKIDPQGARGHPSPLSIAICGAAISAPSPSSSTLPFRR